MRRCSPASGTAMPCSAGRRPRPACSTSRCASPTTATTAPVPSGNPGDDPHRRARDQRRAAAAAGRRPDRSGRRDAADRAAAPSMPTAIRSRTSSRSTTCRPARDSTPRTGVFTWTPDVLRGRRVSGHRVRRRRRRGSQHRAHRHHGHCRPTTRRSSPAFRRSAGRRTACCSSRWWAPIPTAMRSSTRWSAAIQPGVFFDPVTGRFEWTPTFDQAGHYTFTFQARDFAGLTDTLDVQVRIADVNRAPVIQLHNHLAQLGEPLELRHRRFRPGSQRDAALLGRRPARRAPRSTP